MVHMTDEACHRCDNTLASSNKSKERLCGECQRELAASRGTESAALREWIAAGRKRVVYRHGPAPIAAAPIMEPSALATFLDAQRKAVEARIADLDRQRREAEEILRLLTPSPVPEPKG